MGEKLNRFGRSLKQTLKNMGTATEKVMNRLEEAEKKVMKSGEIKKPVWEEFD